MAMKTFAVLVDAVPNFVERRQPYRQEHLERLRRLKEEGKLLMAGAWADTVDGALLVFKAEDAAEVKRLIEDDVYHRNGLWTAYRVREWGLAIQ